MNENALQHFAVSHSFDDLCWKRSALMHKTLISSALLLTQYRQIENAADR
jgi:hypothetical protein